MNSDHVRQGEGGFALFLVIILLFTVGVLGATGYQVAVLSSELAMQGKEGQRALSIARAGIQRYMTEEVGTPADTATYAIDDGDAVVTSRLVAQQSDTVSLYVIKSEGIYLDPISASTPARRTVYQFAERRLVPFDHEAVATLASGDLVVGLSGTVEGRDQARNNDCEERSVDIMGALSGGGLIVYSGNDLNGSPDSLTLGSYQEVVDSIGVNWDVYTDPNFIPDFENSWPGGGLPPDSFPVVRWTRNATARAGQSGQGVLIVEGRLTPRNAFRWQGIILTEEMSPITNGGGGNQSYTLEGLVVTGLGNGGGTWTVTQFATVEYNRCYAYQAGRSLAYFRPIDDAWWEGS